MYVLMSLYFRIRWAIFLKLKDMDSHQTKEDNTVTIRYRNSMQQERIAIAQVKNIVTAALQA